MLLAQISLILSLTICLYHKSYSAGPLDYILSPYSGVIDKFYLLVQVMESTREYHLWVCPYSSSSVTHVLVIWFGWF